jgi:hypothetical protein
MEAHAHKNGHHAAVWATPAGILAVVALIGALISIGWNYRGLAFAEEELKSVKVQIGELQGKQERVAVLEVKLDTALRTLDKISVQLEAYRRPAR